MSAPPRLAPAAYKVAEVRLAAEHELAEPACLRARWLTEIGMDARESSASLRYNRPQSLAEERELLDVVRKHLEWERTCDEAMRACM